MALPPNSTRNSSAPTVSEKEPSSLGSSEVFTELPTGTVPSGFCVPKIDAHLFASALSNVVNVSMLASRSSSVLYPASSGTGFLDISSWIQIWGEEKAWKYMDQLHKNIGVYTHSGSKPCKQAGSGEFAIGISWPGRAIKIIKAGAPIDMIIPEEGIGWEMQVVAIMSGTDNLPDAKRLMNWTLGRGMNLFGERQSIIADPSKVTKDPELPDFYDEVQAKLINNDFVWAAANKTRLVSEWKKRYDGKTEPKK